LFEVVEIVSGLYPPGGEGMPKVVPFEIYGLGVHPDPIPKVPVVLGIGANQSVDRQGLQFL